MKSLVVPVEVEDAAPDEPKLKGKREWNAGADMAAIASALRAFELFTDDPEAPRAGLDELPDGLADAVLYERAATTRPLKIRGGRLRLRAASRCR